MRRAERKIDASDELETIIKKCFHVVVCMCDGRVPYAVPMNFAYAGDTVYLHCAREGRKMSILEQAGGSAPVHLVFVGEERLLDKGGPACGLSAEYSSVMGEGTLEEIHDHAERMAAMRFLLAQVGQAERVLPAGDAMTRTAMLRVRLHSLVGKRNSRS